MNESPWTVLIIDDNRDDCAEVRRTLLRGSDRRFTFHAAETGHAALQTLSQWSTQGAAKPDVVVMDFHLPDMTAMQLLESLEQAYGSVCWPVVVLTGSMSQDAGADVLRAGAQDFLNKKGITEFTLPRLLENAVERFELHRSLKESETRSRLALDAARALVYEMPVAAGARVQASGVAALFANQAPFSDTFSDSAWRERIHPEDLDAYLLGIETAVRTAGSYRCEYRMRAGDGRWVYVEDVGQIVCNGRGAPERRVGTVVDVTQRATDRRALEQANRQKDEFLAMLAHELRNPLAPIKMSIELLRRPITPVIQQRALDILGRQSTHLGRLVDDLLDVSRITSGKIALRQEPVDMGAAIGAALEAVQPLIHSRSHRLHVTTPSDPLMVKGDVVRLTQVVTNLLTNAAKYMEPSGTIDVALTRDGAQAVVEVRDSGVGIDAELLSRIFEPFVQADRSLDRSQGGLGLGLTLVKRLVTLHGGTVTAHSDGIGAGSVFTLTFPLLAQASTAGCEEHPQSYRRLNGVRVLVVDDNRDAADSVADLLHLEGCEVQVAYDGLRAMHLAQTGDPHVAILDVGLPDITGLEIATRLKAQAATESICLIALTGYAQLNDKKTCLHSGFDHHFTKPVDGAALLKVLQGRAQSRG